MMFRILILQEYFGLSDEQMEFQITDRFSFMRFLGLRSCDKVPDSNTIWHFRERLNEGDVIKELFDRFTKELTKQGLIVNKGKIIDATIVKVPVQRNNKEENEQIKQGDVPVDWDEKRRRIKTRMRGGQKRTTRIILAIRITSTWIAKESSSTTMWLRTPVCTTA